MGRNDYSIQLKKEVEKRIAKARSAIEPALPKHVNFDAMVAKTFLEIHSNRELQKSPPVSPVSVFWAFVHATSLGLSIGKYSEEAYIVPFREKDNPNRRAQLIIAYKGMIKLAYQHPLIAAINTHYVCENDQFDADLGSTPKILFRPNIREERGPLIAAFSVIEMSKRTDDAHVAKIIELMSRRDIDKVRASARNSQDPSSPWNTWYEEMASKTVLRRTLKRAPKSTELDKAFTIERQFEEGELLPGENDEFEDATGTALPDGNGGRTQEMKGRLKAKASDI
jgi:recombination protein RecT